MKLSNLGLPHHVLIIARFLQSDAKTAKIGAVRQGGGLTLLSVQVGQRELWYKKRSFCSLPPQGNCLLSYLFLLKEKRKLCLYAGGVY